MEIEPSREVEPRVNGSLNQVEVVEKEIAVSGTENVEDCNMNGDEK